MSRHNRMPLYLYSIMFHRLGRSAFCLAANVSSRLWMEAFTLRACCGVKGKLIVVSPT